MESHCSLISWARSNTLQLQNLENGEYLLVLAKVRDLGYITVVSASGNTEVVAVTERFPPWLKGRSNVLHYTASLLFYNPVLMMEM
jgi:hypothetical protein